MRFTIYNLVPSATNTIQAEHVIWDTDHYAATVIDLDADRVFAALQAGGVYDAEIMLEYHEPSELDCMVASTYHPRGAQ